MDPALAPINGITLERYAELGAQIADFHDNAQKVAEVMQREHVSQADWEAAKAGWTARMQDMSLMGRVAMAYMPLYQTALARKNGGRASASYEDYVAVSAAIKVFGFEAAMNACGITMAEWTEIGGHWNQEMARNMMQYAGHPNYLAQEEHRIRAGGQPKRIHVTREAGVVPAAPAPNANPYAAAMGVPAGTYVPPNAGPMAAAMANPAYQQSLQNQQQIAASPFGALGFGLGQAAAFLGGGIVPGSNVVVTGPDGRPYPGRVMQTGPQQMLVQFGNGAQQWVPNTAVRQA
jgi:hypothetical protein